jgi:hypothetical protein
MIGIPEEAPLIVWRAKDGTTARFQVGCFRERYCYWGTKKPEWIGKDFQLSRVPGATCPAELEYHEVPCSGSQWRGPCCDLCPSEEESHR